MTLHDAQQLLFNCLFYPEADNNSHISLDQNQVAIYRESIFGSFIKALSETYPVCKKLVGEKFFDAMAYQYIQVTPSLYYDLNTYGKSFAEFIEQFKPAQDLVYLPDTARLEWAISQSFSAINTSPSNLHQLDKLTDQQHEHIQFLLEPSSFLIQSPYPIDLIWNNNQDNQDSNTNIQLDDGTTYLIVWHRHFQLQIETLTEQQWTLLISLKAKQTLSEVCETWEHTYPDVDINNILTVAIQQGWINRFIIKQT